MRGRVHSTYSNICFFSNENAACLPQLLGSGGILG